MNDDLAICRADATTLSTVAMLCRDVGYGGGVRPQDAVFVARAGRCVVGALPPFLAERLARYLARGERLVAMRRPSRRAAA